MKRAIRAAIALVACGLALSSAGAGSGGVTFKNVARQSGIDFQHTNGRVGNRYMLEVKGSGVAFLDYDNDGFLDIYAVSGNNLPGARSDVPPTNRLYRGSGDGSFTDVTERAGVGDQGYGHGVACADYDNDGDQDIYVTNYGPNVLYRNDGDGTFTDISKTAGVAGRGVWSASAAFCDFDHDGLLDLYVTNYVVYDTRMSVPLPRRPFYYDAEPDVLYRNNGDGSFTDVTQRAGIGSSKGKGLGIVCLDYDADGDLDAYVANDSVSNFLYRNDGHAAFRDVTLFSGTGLNGDGTAEAGMGVDAGDYDDDGDMDILVVNYQGESNTLYANQGKGFFIDNTSPANLAAASLPRTTFGAAFLDFDNDGDLDIFAANGGTFEDRADYAQSNQLFENLGGGRYEEVSSKAGSYFGVEAVSRGAAFGDYDNDGDVDVLVGNMNGLLDLLQNQGGNRQNWLLVKTIGTKSNRDGIGARIRIWAPNFVRIKDVKSAYSIVSSNDLRVHFGLGGLSRIQKLEIRWPSGLLETVENVPANRLIILKEAAGSRIVSLN